MIYEKTQPCDETTTKRKCCDTAEETSTKRQKVDSVTQGSHCKVMEDPSQIDSPALEGSGKDNFVFMENLIQLQEFVNLQRTCLDSMAEIGKFLGKDDNLEQFEALKLLSAMSSLTVEFRQVHDVMIRKLKITL